MSRYENHNLQDQELPFIYKERAEPPARRLGGSNWHENIEIIYISKGDGVVSINGRLHEVSEGDAVVIDANRLHAIAAGKCGMTHRYLIIDRAFCLLNGFDTNLLSFEAKITDARVSEWMERLYGLYFSAQEDSRWRVLAIRTCVLELMLLLCREYATPMESSERIEHTATYVKQAIDYIRASYEKNFSLDDVAAFVGVSRYYLSREFHKYTGYSFVAYVNYTRCKMAQMLLADDRLSICEVGRRCGFENRSYFAKCFSRYVGMLPAQYREEINAR